jgi:adenosylmethionine-8-amino-7-oxononanoate aminotransferase
LWGGQYTDSGHTTARATALANLDIIEREALETRARSLEGPLAAALEPLTAHALVSEVRVGVGLLAAVQLDPGQVESEPSLPLRAAAASRGLITRVLAGGGLQISPLS